MAPLERQCVRVEALFEAAAREELTRLLQRRGPVVQVDAAAVVAELEEGGELP